MATQTLKKQDHDLDILVAQEIDADISYGARQLIAYHRAGAPVDIKSWGTADTVYEDITSQLIAYGMQQGMAQDMTRRLVQYAVEHADMFRTEHNANIIAVRLTVDEMNPAAQFETGPVATFRLNGLSRQAEMASASGQNVRLTASGTATTSSDRSSVENVWQGVKEWSVWGKMEAPDKTELAGQAPGVIATALAQMASGDLTPAEAATLQAQLEALANEGLIAPELADIVRALETMRAMIKGGITVDASMVQPQALAKYIAGLVEQGVENGNLPPELARQVMQSIADFSDGHGLDQVFTAEMMQSLSATVEWTAVTQALSEIMPHLSAEGRAAIEAMLEGGDVPAGESRAEQIAVINELIAQADLPEGAAEHVAVLEQSAAILQEIAQNQIDPAAAKMDAPQMPIDLTALSAEEIHQIISSMDGIDPADLAPEQADILQTIQDAMGTVDLSDATPETIQTALSGRGGAAMDAITPAAMVGGMTAARFAPITGSGGSSAIAAPTPSSAPSVSTQDVSRPTHTPPPVQERKAETVVPVVTQKKNDVSVVKNETKKPEKKPDEKIKATENKKPDLVVVPTDKKPDPVKDTSVPKKVDVKLTGSKPNVPDADNKKKEDLTNKEDGCGPTCDCDPKTDFKKAAKENGGELEIKLATGAVITVTEKGEVKVGDKVFSEKQVKEIIARDKEASQRIQATKGSDVITADQLAQYIGAAPGGGSPIRNTFHICGSGCDHSGPTGQVATVKEIKIKVGEAVVGRKLENVSLDKLLKASKGKFDGWERKPSGP